jgi:hypothetical protein
LIVTRQDGAPGHMIRDRDRIYGAVVKRRLRAMGIRDKPIAPWQNGFAERLIGTIRRECLDHIIVSGEAHLRRILLSLNKDAPVSRSVQRAGVISSSAIQGGLHHHYGRIWGFQYTQPDFRQVAAGQDRQKARCHPPIKAGRAAAGKSSYRLGSEQFRPLRIAGVGKPPAKSRVVSAQWLSWANRGMQGVVGIVTIVIGSMTYSTALLPS